jgi:hypothetical protein
MKKLRRGLTIEEYEERLTAQGGVCAICGRPPNPKRRFAVDHNHKTGQTRGLLCWICNLKVLGRLERFMSFATLARIAAYLRKFDPENPLLRE